MADSFFNTYIPPTTLDKFTGVNLSDNMGLGVSKMKLNTDGGNAKRAEMGLPQYRKSLNKFITQRSEGSYLDGREALESVKAAAAGAPTESPDYSSKLIHSLEAAELEKKESGLTDEQIEEMIRKRKVQREALEKCLEAKGKQECIMKTKGALSRDQENGEFKFEPSLCKWAKLSLRLKVKPTHAANPGTDSEPTHAANPGTDSESDPVGKQLSFKVEKWGKHFQPEVQDQVGSANKWKPWKPPGNVAEKLKDANVVMHLVVPDGRDFL